ncbi:MAG: TPM domain-containing protein, partial [Bacteroidota bacterium]|nr:TPM domain-containing protein [Bacteroidota bacterium]
DGILSNATVDTLNKMIKEANDSAFIQIAVLMLNSIGDADSKTFAHEILNKWHVGDKATNNGLVIVFVLDQRKISFETGYGTEIMLTDAECYTIQQDYMLPYFKTEDYDTGILEGVYACIEEAKTDSYLISSDNSNDYSSDNNYSNNYNYANNSNSTALSLFILYVAMLIPFTLLFVIFLLISFTLPDRYKRYQLIRFFSMLIWAIIFPIPFIGVKIWLKNLMEKWRNTTRISPSGQRMHKLNETDDDEYLKGGQITEEKIKSIDYDVWVTDDKEEVLILAYKRWFSGYSQCTKCRFKTFYQEYDKVITAATYSSSGTGEKKHTCAHCGHSVIRRYTIAKKQKTSSSSSSYGSYGGGGSSSSSWGGGSSGGGGASSSW